MKRVKEDGQKERRERGARKEKQQASKQKRERGETERIKRILSAHFARAVAAFCFTASVSFGLLIASMYVSTIL